MLELKNFMPINFLKKREILQEVTTVCVFVWKSWIWKVRTDRAWVLPFGLSHMVMMPLLRKKRNNKSLSFDADGIAKGVDWLNEQFEGQKARWKAVSRVKK